MTGGMGSSPARRCSRIRKSELLQVPYRGVEPATVAIMAGDIDLVFSFSNHRGAAIGIRAASKALATTALKRGSLPFPELPTISEVFPGFEIFGWSGVSVPAGTPADIIARLNREMNAVIKMPEISVEAESRRFGSGRGHARRILRGRMKIAE